MKKGFTLIELIVVFAIIVLIASIIITNMEDSKLRGIVVRKIRDMKEVVNALEIYKTETGSFPISGSGGLEWNNESGGGWIPGITPDYITELPNDPSGSSVGYAYRSDGNNYKIITWGVTNKECDFIESKYAHLEDSQRQCGSGNQSWGFWTQGGANW